MLVGCLVVARNRVDDILTGLPSRLLLFTCFPFFLLMSSLERKAVLVYVGIVAFSNTPV